MDARVVFFPALVMVALTIVVWFRMYFMRVGQMKREQIHPQRVATAAQSSALLTDSRAADNFRNLFELPVLFYLALAAAAVTGAAGPVFLALAWLFVGLRVLHSAIHCTYNKVIHRFYAYLGGGLVLWALWVVLALEWLR